ncbi:MAG: hypothetical protein ACKPKO_35600, partial [Candidatus Fonsibacter sp.]
MMLFKLSHSSSYTRQDIDILDDYRTIAHVGIINTTTHHILNKFEYIYIYISKAATSTCITHKKRFLMG